MGYGERPLRTEQVSIRCTPQEKTLWEGMVGYKGLWTLSDLLIHGMELLTMEEAGEGPFAASTANQRPADELVDDGDVLADFSATLDDTDLKTLLGETTKVTLHTADTVEAVEEELKKRGVTVAKFPKSKDASKPKTKDVRRNGPPAKPRKKGGAK